MTISTQQILSHLFYKILDIDECAEKTHRCHNNGSCTDTEGSYTCTRTYH